MRGQYESRADDKILLRGRLWVGSAVRQSNTICKDELIKKVSAGEGNMRVGRMMRHRYGDDIGLDQLCGKVHSGSGAVLSSAPGNHS